MRRTLIALLCIIMLTLAACGGGDDDNDTPEASGNEEAVTAVENYLQAKVAGDEDGIREFICADMESAIAQEASSFASVEASLEDMDCSLNGELTDGQLVTCNGQITALYGTENQSFPLSTYRAVEEDGEWRWCGEAQATEG